MFELITALFLVAVSVPYGYILLTGRWLNWRFRPTRAAGTARYPRRTAAGMLLVLLPLAVDSAAGSLFGPTTAPGHIFGVVIRGGMLLLILLGAVLVLTGAMVSTSDAAPRRYKVEGWPPPAASGSGKR